MGWTPDCSDGRGWDDAARRSSRREEAGRSVVGPSLVGGPSWKCSRGGYAAGIAGRPASPRITRMDADRSSSRREEAEPATDFTGGNRGNRGNDSFANDADWTTRSDVAAEVRRLEHRVQGRNVEAASCRYLPPTSGETPLPLYACLPRSRAAYGAGFVPPHVNSCGYVQKRGKYLRLFS